MNTQIQKFECWAIVELMGHQQMAGYVAEQTIGSSAFLRISVPETAEQPAYDRFLNPSAIYAINPVDEQTARYRAGQLKLQPIAEWDLREWIRSMSADKQAYLLGLPPAQQAPDESAQRAIDAFGSDDDDLDY